MIPHGVEIFVGLEPIDLRWGIDRLAGVVLERIGRDARGGALFVFFGKRRDRLRIVFHDGTGMCLFYNQLPSHYTSFDFGQGSLPRLRTAPIAAARSLTRSHRLQCFVGGAGGSS